jgi:HEPN domain-containing protein
MTNAESAERLLKEAEHIFGEELARCLQEGAHNLAIRRAQEVVELALKALIKFLGADFPKVHDPAMAFIQLAPKKGLAISRADLARIQKISFGLA